MKHEIFFYAYTWMICCAQVDVAEETIVEKYDLETLLMGENHDMVKKAVYLGRTLE